MPSPEEPQEARPVWCVVANVVHTRPCGSGGEIRRGGKHFAPGAKVYVVAYYWGTGGDRVIVVGRHRKSHRYMTIVVASSHLANWRAELAYSPHVVSQVMKHNNRFMLPNDDDARAQAEAIAADFIRRGALTQPFNTRPPMG